MNERSINGVRVARPTNEDLYRLQVGDWAPDVAGGWHRVSRIIVKNTRVDGKLFASYYTERGSALPTILVQDEEARTLEWGILIQNRFPTWGEMDQEYASDVADELIRRLLPEDLGDLYGDELRGGGPLRDRIEQICQESVEDGEVVDVGRVVDIASHSEEACRAAEEYWPPWPRRQAGVPFYREGGV